MRMLRHGWIAGFVAVCLAGGSAPAAAESSAQPSGSVTLEPGRYASVNGDASQFRAFHWMNDGYVGGITDAEAKYELPDGAVLETEGHAVPGDHDYSGLVSLRKEDVGYLIFDYNQFRKYFENGGGFFRPFRLLNQNYTDRELALDIGKIELEAGLTLKNLPDIEFIYEHEFKKGTKSRTTWTTVTDFVGATSTGRKIGPAWQEVDEEVNSFKVKLDDETPWFNWKAEQYWEAVRSRNLREEAQLSAVNPAGTPSDGNQKVRDQATDLRSNVIATTLGADRWFLKDTAFVSSGYRFSQINSRELENIFEYDQNGVLTNFSFPEQVRDAHSDNLYTSHTWVGSFLWKLFDHATMITRMKAESIHRNSQSTYPKDTSPSNSNGTSKPDGNIDQIDVSENQEKVARFGESLSFRYTGVPRLAVYNDYELEQTRSNLYEDRRSASAGEVFNRQDITHMHRAIGTLGGQWMPWEPFTMTLQGRVRNDDVDYNHVRYTDNSTSGAKSVFIDEQNLFTDEVMAKAAWKPSRYFQPSFRYQLMDRTYKTWGLPNSSIAVETHMISSTYTGDVVSFPADSVLLTASVSWQDGKIITPARELTTADTVPTFDFDVFSTLFSGEYSLRQDVVLFGTVTYTRADNFNDFSALGLPLGADFHKTDLSVGVRWSPKKDLTVEPKYEFYQYRTDPDDSEVGDFNAHVLWLEIRSVWG